MNGATFVYNTVMEYYATHGMMPSLRAIANATKLPFGTVAAHMTTLESWGWIERSYMLARPTEAGLTPGELRERLEREPVECVIVWNEANS